MVGEPEVVRIRLVRSTGCRLYLTDMDAIAAVVTTGIYCRPGCGAQPQARNVRTFSLAAAAEAAGYRACLRCRPYRTSLPVAWTGPELVCRAVQLILDGALDQGTEATLGARLGASGRHLRRLFVAHLGISPDGLARSARRVGAAQETDPTSRISERRAEEQHDDVDERPVAASASGRSVPGAA